MGNVLDDPLHCALASLRVRAWRLHLRTPGVRATVPMIRGVWGKELRRLSESIYDSVFTGTDETPRYLLRPASPEMRPAPAIEFLLFGPPDDREDDVLWAAWENACTSGLGPDRRPFAVRRVRPLAWDGTPLSNTRSQPGFFLYPLPWPGDDPTRPCRLEFAAPLRLIYKSRLVERPGLADLAIAALRRICKLSEAPCDRLWNDRDQWLNVARTIPCRPWQGQRLDLVRYSGSQDKEVELRGVNGSLTLPEGPGPLAPLLAAAAWLHLGKGTVMGLGQLRIVPAY